MKLVIEKDADGCIFAYREPEKHHKIVEKTRSKHQTRLEPKVLDSECNLFDLDTSSYIVFDIK